MAISTRKVNHNYCKLIIRIAALAFHYPSDIHYQNHCTYISDGKGNTIMRVIRKWACGLLNQLCNAGATCRICMKLLI